MDHWRQVCISTRSVDRKIFPSLHMEVSLSVFLCSIASAWPGKSQSWCAMLPSSFTENSWNPMADRLIWWHWMGAKPSATTKLIPRCLSLPLTKPCPRDVGSSVTRHFLCYFRVRLLTGSNTQRHEHDTTPLPPLFTRLFNTHRTPETNICADHLDSRFLKDSPLLVDDITFIHLSCLPNSWW